MQDQEQNDPNQIRDLNTLFDNLVDLILKSVRIVIVATLILRGTNIQLVNFHPLNQWYPPLLTSIGISAFLGLLFQWFTARKPSIAIWLVFRLFPIFTYLLSCLIFIAGFNSRAISVVGLVTTFCSNILHLYGLWVTPRFRYTSTILSLSMRFSPPGRISLQLLSIFISGGLTIFFVVLFGIGKITTNVIGNFIFVLAMLVIQFLTMQVIRNTMLVTVSRVMYTHYPRTRADHQLNADHEFWGNTLMNCMGAIWFGSMVVPIKEFIHGLFSSLQILDRENHPVVRLVLLFFDRLFSWVIRQWNRPVARAIKRGNRWGFVQVGVENRGIVQASMATWDMFSDNEMAELIRTDIAGAFCFFSGVAGGTICSMVNVIWGFVVHNSYDLKISLFSFLIGYYMVQNAMAWPHACVLAYHVAYATNPHAQGFDNTIPDRIAQLPNLQDDRPPV